MALRYSIFICLTDHIIFYQNRHICTFRQSIMIKQTEIVIKCGQNYELLCNKNQHKLIIRYWKQNILQLFQYQVPDVEKHPILHEYFQSFEHLLNFLKEEQSTQVTLGTEIKVKLLAKINTTKTKVIKISQFTFTKMHQSQKQLLNEIRERCTSQFPLKDQEIKHFMLLMASFGYHKLQYLNDQIQKKNNYMPHNSYQIDNPNFQNQQHENVKYSQIQKQYKTQIDMQFQQIADKMDKQFQNINRFMKQNYKYRTQNEEKRYQLQKKMIKLQAKHQQEIDEIMDQLVKFEISFVQKINQKILQLSSSFTTSQSDNQMLQKIEELRLNFIDIDNRVKQIQSQVGTVIKMEVLDKIKQEHNFCLKFSRQLQRLQEQEISISDWIDSKCSNYNNLIINDKIIEVKDSSEIFGKIRLKDQAEFTVKFLRLKIFGGIGIIDSKHKNIKNLGLKDINRYAYWSHGRSFIEQKEKESTIEGFVEGQSITVCIDFESGTIEWKSGTQIRNKFSCKKLTDSKICWVPYIYLEDQGDIIQLCL